MQHWVLYSDEIEYFHGCRVEHLNSKGSSSVFVVVRHDSHDRHVLWKTRRANYVEGVKYGRGFYMRKTGDLGGGP